MIWKKEEYFYVVSCCSRFFEQYYDAVLKKAYIKEYDFNGHIARMVYIFVEFKNINVFGNGYFHKGVFERYRKVTHEMYDFLKKYGIEKKLDKFEIPVIPLLNEEYYYGEEVDLPEKDQDLTSPLEIIQLDRYGKKEEMMICQGWPEVNWGLKRISDGRIYHIGESNYLAYVAACESKQQIDTIVDLGVGSGNTARLAVSRYKPRRMILNDYDKGVCEQLDNAIRTDYKEKNIMLEIISGDCMKIGLPDNCVDILDISTNKDVLASYFHIRSQDVNNALKPDGIVIAQVGGISTMFEQLVLTGEVAELQRWPWMNHITSFNKLFKYYRFLSVGAEVVFLGTNDAKILDNTVRNMSKYADITDYTFCRGADVVLEF